MRSSETPAALRGLVRAQEQRRALVDVDVGAHALRVREHDHAVVGRRPSGSPPASTRSATTRAGCRPRRRRSVAHSSLDVALVLVDRCGPPRRAARSRTAGRRCVGATAPVRHLVCRWCRAGRRRSPMAHGASSPVSHVELTRGSRRARQRVCIDSRRRRSARRRTRRAGSASAISLTSSCGLLPPTVDTAVAFGAMPRLRDQQRAGIGVRPRHDLHDRDDVDAGRAARAPGVGVGERAASSRSSIGDRALVGRRRAARPDRHRRRREHERARMP